MAGPSSITGKYGTEVDRISGELVKKNESDLVALYDFIMQEEQKVQELKNKLDIQRVNEIAKATQQQAVNLANFELELESQGIETSAKLRREFLDKDLKEKHDKEMKDLIEYYRQKRGFEKEKADIEERVLNLEYDITRDRLNIQSKEEQLLEAQKAGDAKKVAQLQAEVDKLKKDQSEKEKQLKEEKTSQALDSIVEENFKDLLGFVKDIEELGAKGTIEKQMVEQLTDSMKQVGKAIGESLNKINNAISTYASYQTEINSRLQGIVVDGRDKAFNDSVKILSDVAFSPLVKTEELYSNLSQLVGEGISSNVEQKAFLQTVKKGIASTFDVNTQALKNIIKIQQFDSTAARLGMEAYLTRFLNEFAQNTEYLSTTFDSVTESLLQASATMSGKEATEFEYIVQKWLGTLTSVGLSETTARNIATAIGQLGSGNIQDLSNTAMQNLLVMAAGKSGDTNFSQMLTGGLNYYTTNTLMNSVVSYLQELSNYENNVVKSQLAQTFGVTLSDLMAIQNIDKDELAKITQNAMSYSGMYDELEYQMGELSSRVGISNILENLFANLNFQTGMNIAKNPALYATWKITDLIQGVTGGINIPFISAMGNGFDLNTTVENLIKLGIVGVSTLGNIGDIISGISSVGNSSKLLSALGIGANASSNTIVRGGGLSGRTSGMSTSLTTMVGNTEGSAYYESSLNAASDEANSKVAEAQSEQEDYTKNIFEMMDEIEFGKRMESMDKNIGDIYGLLSSGGLFSAYSLEGLNLGEYEY